MLAVEKSLDALDLINVLVIAINNAAGTPFPETSPITKQNLSLQLTKKTTGNLIVSLGKNLPNIYGNFQNLEQVVINLIQNSCHALTSKDKSITISTTLDKLGNFIVMKVADEGSGIDEKNMKYIKEPFFTTKRSSGGVGLGLSVSQKIIEEHDGVLNFSSIPGSGTTAKVMLPFMKSKSK